MKKNLINLIYITLLFVSLLLFSCTSKNTNNTSGELDPIKLEVKKGTESIHSIGLITDVNLISLDCNETIGEINKVVRFNHKLYLLDVSQNNSVYIFSENGSYINHIANYGNGPEEYIDLMDIYINPEDSTLNLVSRIDKKRITYDLNGQFIAVEKMPKSFVSMLKINGGYIAFMGHNTEDSEKPFNVWSLDDTYNVRGASFTINPSINYSKSGHTLSQFGDIIHFITPRDYHVYSIGDDGKGTVNYTFELDGLEYPDDVDEKAPAFASPYIDRFRDFQETTHHLLVGFLYNGQYLMGVYNKETQRVHVVTLESNEEKYFVSFGQIVGYDEHTIYAMVDASSMKTAWDGRNAYNDFRDKYPQQINNLRTKFKQVDPEGNPYLMMYSIN